MAIHFVSRTTRWRPHTKPRCGPHYEVFCLAANLGHDLEDTATLYLRDKEVLNGGAIEGSGAVAY
jgi:hypothetical protein